MHRCILFVTFETRIPSLLRNGYSETILRRSKMWNVLCGERRNISVSRYWMVLTSSCRICNEKKIKNVNEIKLIFRPSYVLPPDHFIKNINSLLDEFKDDIALQQQSVNPRIGLFGKTKRSVSMMKYTLNMEEAAL